MFNRIVRVIKANIPSFVRQAEEPEAILEAAFLELQTYLAQLRQGIAAVIATQKRHERQIANAQSYAKEWYSRAQLALKQGSEALAREALIKRQTYLVTVTNLSKQTEQYKDVLSQLKQDMRTLELKVAELKTKKDLYIARSHSAQASYRIQEMLHAVSDVSSLDIWRRIEEKINLIEAQSEVLGLTGSDPLANKFVALKSIDNLDNVDTELTAIKMQILSTGDKSNTDSEQ